MVVGLIWPEHSKNSGKEEQQFSLSPDRFLLQLYLSIALVVVFHLVVLRVYSRFWVNCVQGMSPTHYIISPALAPGALDLYFNHSSC